MNEKVLGFIGTLGCILLGVIASLIAWFGGLKDTQSHTREVVRKFFNFEITILILALILCLIPVIGQLACVVLNLANLYYAIVAFIAVKNNKEFKAPSYEFIK